MVKRLCLFVLLPLLLVLGILIGTAQMLAEPREALPQPDLARLITLPDGRTEPLGELLMRLEADRAAPDGAAARARESALEVEVPGAGAGELAEDETPRPRVTWSLHDTLDPNDVFDLAELAFLAGRDEEALDLFLSVPTSHRSYARARRRAGWELLTQRMDRPGAGLRYVQQSLAADPFSGNAWQDTARIYLRTLGSTWDPVRDPPGGPKRR